MTPDVLKQMAAKAALDHFEHTGIIGVGTGSTVNHFIDQLATIKHRIDGTVSSSEASTARLKAHGIPVMDLNAAGVDGTQTCMLCSAQSCRKRSSLAEECSGPWPS